MQMLKLWAENNDPEPSPGLCKHANLVLSCQNTACVQQNATEAKEHATEAKEFIMMTKSS